MVVRDVFLIHDKRFADDHSEDVKHDGLVKLQIRRILDDRACPYVLITISER